MSSTRRPWYPWYPKDFVVDEKVQALSPLAELLYRRALDVMWQANTCQLPDNCQKLANQIGKGLSQQEFENAWSEIQFPGFELFKKTEDGLFIYSKRLREEAQKIEIIQEKRRELGQKGGLAKATAIAKAKAVANAKQNGSHTDTYTDNNTPPPPKGGRRQKNEYSKSFEDFWTAYPSKVGKDAAYRSWKKIGKRGDVPAGVILAAIVAQVKAKHFNNGKGEPFIPNPSTWLNQGRWKDEIKNASQPTTPIYRQFNAEEFFGENR